MTLQSRQNAADVLENLRYDVEQLEDSSNSAAARPEPVGVNNVIADNKIRDQLKQWEDAGYGNLPVCMAKTCCRRMAPL